MNTRYMKGERKNRDEKLWTKLRENGKKENNDDKDHADSHNDEMGLKARQKRGKSFQSLRT